MTQDRIKVYKFGGASVKSAEAFRNLARIVKTQAGGQQLLLVVSAMGKTTNALEALLDLAHRQQAFEQEFLQLKSYHLQVLSELFPQQGHPVFQRLEHLFEQLHAQLAKTLPNDNFDTVYDQTVSFGELLSSTILHYFLEEQDLHNTLIDSRKYIQTDSTWREARVDWGWTERLIRRDVPAMLQEGLVVTQGFLGGTNNGLTTTLGREGSDFSAAVFAYCLEAEGMYIWKDVEGLLNADPKYFADTVCYPEISYQETVEMAYYGASVIHPKTIKPLANKQIPLYVKSFLNPEGAGTKICNCRFEVIAPAYIIKEKQCLVSFGVKDFTFISEQNLGTIFNALSELRIKINLMQNSAISFSICTDYHPERLHRLIQTLHDQFVIHYNTELRLYTIKNYDAASINRMMAGKAVLLEQRTRTTFQFVSR
ncbi:aspartate kinase [Pontibacter actiniarum]|uniref:Aspartokinase n=1 Tax=Pontibacter actiniarum TaxID=323450 RepID=A0A1X9YMC1_9BACT|nr:aspartate kinase [Pontibacter actiniarum]ARS34023.1 aspartate kinase [Pontibacter actiniarum]